MDSNLFSFDENTAGPLVSLEVEKDEAHTLTEQQRKLYLYDKHRLNNANLIAAVWLIIHFVGAVVVAIVWNSRFYRAVDSESFVRQNGNPELHLMGRYSLSWIAVPVPLLAALAHSLLLWGPVRDHVQRISLHHGQCHLSGWNWFRWAEYSLTGGLIVWTVAQLAGLTDSAAMYSLMALTIMMYIGCALAHELINFGWAQRDGRRAKWWFMILAVVPFVTIWGVILAAFITQAVAGSPPVYVYLMVIVMLLMTASFVLPILFRYSTWPWMQLSSNYGYEMFHLLLSVATKTAFVWIYILGSVV